MKLDKDKLINKLTIKINAFQDRSDRGFGSGFDSRDLGALRELTWFRAAILRGEFDSDSKDWTPIK